MPQVIEASSGDRDAVDMLSDALGPNPHLRILSSAPPVLAALHWSGPIAPAPLMFIPGAGGNGALWGDLVEALGREAWAVDPPGFGDSERIPSADLLPIVDTLATVARSTLSQPAVWIGHSWGGKVSALIGALHPDVARALVLVDPSPVSAVPLDDEGLVSFAHSIWDGAGGPWPSVEAALDALRRRRHYRRWTHNIEAAVRREIVPSVAGGWTSRVTLEDLCEICDKTLRVDHSELVAALEVPTLYLVASASVRWQGISNDVVLPGHVQREVVDGEHFLHLADPTDIASRIEAFLDRL